MKLPIYLLHTYAQGESTISAHLSTEERDAALVSFAESQDFDANEARAEGDVVGDEGLVEAAEVYLDDCHGCQHDTDSVEIDLMELPPIADLVSQARRAAILLRLHGEADAASALETCVVAFKAGRRAA